MAEIILTPDTESTLQNLIEVLYKKEYVGFWGSCYDYAAEIYDFCVTLPQQQHRATANNKHSEWYCRYSHSRRTHWFIIFDLMTTAILSGILSTIIAAIIRSLLPISDEVISLFYSP